MKTVSRGRIVAFALLLVVVLVAGFYTSGGKFGGLRSEFINNPNFVCTQASLMSGEVRYNQSTADIERLMVEKTALEKQVQKWKIDIETQEAQVRRLEAQKKSADKKVKTLDNYIDKNCSASALKSLPAWRSGGTNPALTEKQKICAQKKNELQDAKQDARKLQTQITQQKSALATLNSTITKAQADIISLGKKIKSAQDFKEDYETCKRALSAEVGIADFEIIVSGEVFVNQPFDMTVKALDASGKIIKDYQGTIYFDEDSPKLCDILGTCPILKILFPNNWEYTFTSADNGVRNFAKWISINRADVYNLIVFELKGPNGGIHKTAQVVVKERTNPVATCGNGIKEWSEQCDDGNTNNDDSCDNNCKNRDTSITCKDSNTESSAVDLEVKKIGPWNSFNPQDPNAQDKFNLWVTICVNGKVSINDLKKNDMNTAMAYKYSIYNQTNSIVASDESEMGGGIEDMKNGQCSDVGFSIQPKHRSTFDKSNKIVFELDNKNLIKENDECNNSIVLKY